MKKFLGFILALALMLAVAIPATAETAGADLTGKKVGFSALMMSSEFFGSSRKVVGLTETR